jgi:hypothetical protein
MITLSLRRLGGASPQTWWRFARFSPQTWWRFSADLVALLRRLGGASPQTWWRVHIVQNISEQYRTSQNSCTEHFSEYRTGPFENERGRKLPDER